MKLLYQCQACGTIHTDREVAEWAEKQIPPKPDLTRVTVHTRYDGNEVAEVIEWVLGPLHCYDIYAARMMEEVERLRSRPGPHEWCARVGEHYQLGKEWWSDVVPPCNIVEFSPYLAEDA